MVWCLINKQQKNTPAECVSHSSSRSLGWQMFMKRLLLESRLETQRGFAGSPSRKWYFLRCLGVFAHCECRLARRCWCRYGLRSPAPSSCLLGLCPFTWPAAARHRRFQTPSGRKCEWEGVESGTSAALFIDAPPPRCCVWYQQAAKKNKSGIGHFGLKALTHQRPCCWRVSVLKLGRSFSPVLIQPSISKQTKKQH